MIKEITSVSNQTIVKLLKLKNKKERLSLSKFIVEGFHLVDEAYKANRLQMVISTNEDILNKYSCEKLKVTKNIIEKLADTINPQDLIGIVSIKENASFDEVIKKDHFKIIMLDDVNDPGNLGTIIRSCAAFGYDGILSSLNTVDYYNDKTIRASQGAIFKVALWKEDLIDSLIKLKQYQTTIYGTSLKCSKKMEDVVKTNKLCLIFGNEAHGVSDEVLNHTTENIIIEMNNDVESLNVSVASSIIMYQFKK